MSDSTVESYRNAANLKSILRSDPNVLDILETSVYSTIYHWISKEDGDGEWAKQKLEGPTFIIRRNGQPEHAIFMLNRLNTKNTTIPLIRGEMKVTKVGDVMLQIARRGEKVKRGIWFSEADVVERFHRSILDICGLPTARPLDQSMTLDSPSPSSPAPRPSSSQSVNRGRNVEDGFSKLFAGLMSTGEPSKTSAMSLPQEPSSSTDFQTPSLHPVRTPLPLQDQALRAPTSHLQTSIAITENNPPSSSSNPPTEAQNKQDYMMKPTTGPPGQTVDDLLNSILGITLSTVNTSKPAQPFPPQSSITPAHAHALQSQSNHLPPPETAPPVPVDTKPSQADFQQPVLDHNHTPGMLTQQTIQTMMNGHHPPQPPQTGLNRSEVAIQEAMLDALGGVPDLRPRGRDGFKRILEELVHKEPRFVDDIWTGYLRRMG